MAGLLKYFKRAQEKDSTLPDPDGSLSRDIPSSSIGITNTHMRQVQQEASSERRPWGPYILLTPAQKFSVGKQCFNSSLKYLVVSYHGQSFQHSLWNTWIWFNMNTCWYSMVTCPKFYSLGIVGSYPFRHTVTLLVHQYFTCHWNHVSPFANFLFANWFRLAIRQCFDPPIFSHAWYYVTRPQTTYGCGLTENEFDVNCG